MSEESGEQLMINGRNSEVVELRWSFKATTELKGGGSNTGSGRE